MQPCFTTAQGLFNLHWDQCSSWLQASFLSFKVIAGLPAFEFFFLNPSKCIFFGCSNSCGEEKLKQRRQIVFQGFNSGLKIRCLHDLSELCGPGKELWGRQ